MESKGRSLHAQALEAREKKQDTIGSLSLNDQALLAYDEENDTLGFAEAIANRSITLRNYAQQHDSKRILTLAKYEMIGSVAIAKESGNSQALALPLYNLAEIYEDLGELSEAVTTYKEAVGIMENSPPEMHNRPSVLADMRIHLATCEYKAGDKSALERAEAGLRDLKASNEPDKYAKDVWISGGYMRIAFVLKRDNPEKAKEALVKARAIIETNPELKLRKEQLEKLEASF